MKSRQHKLGDAVSLQQFFRDVEDEEDWIREKEPIVASTNRGKFEHTDILYSPAVICLCT